MMLLDGCFIVELFRKFKERKDIHEHDKVFQINRLQKDLHHDLLLLENQLPFSILVEIVKMTQTSEKEDIISLAICYLNYHAPGPAIQACKDISPDDIEHLLGLLHKCWCFPFAKVVCDRRDRAKQAGRGGGKGTSMNSAIELQAAGIVFQKAKNGHELLDIRFNRSSAIFEIPTFRVDDFTESFLRNMVAYEQQRSNMHPRFVTDYTIVMDYLVNTSKDIGILKEKGVLEHNLGNDAIVATLLNKLTNNVGFSSNNDVFSYPGLLLMSMPIANAM